MADASEDVLVHQDAEPADPEDEMVDFRYLRTQKIPSRGMKDFEPHGTNLQENTLETSRHAMLVALDQTRFHNRDVERAVFDPETGGAWAVKSGGKFSATVGRARKVAGAEKGAAGRLWLLPEEALWLVDRGSLDVRWPAVDGEDEDDGLPMSVQGAYAAFIDGDSLTLNEYTVFSYLKRAGYIVLRAEDNLHNVPRSIEMAVDRTASSAFWSVVGAIWNVKRTEGHLPTQAVQGPLVRPGIYRTYDDIFNRLSLITSHDPRDQGSRPTKTRSDSTLKVTYHVYRTIGTYKKTDPGPPDFYVCVMDARHSTVPTEPELHDLLAQTPYHPHKEGTNMYKKLKEGYRNVLLAVVDQGITSFLNLADAAFGNEMLRDRPKQQNKGPFKGSYRPKHSRHRR